MARMARGTRQKTLPLHSRLQDAGAQFGAYNGWERANWFAQAGDDTSEESTQTWDRAGPWEQRIREECEAVRDNCGILAITGFSRYSVTGEGARDFVDSLTASRLPKPGRISLAYFPDNRGRILTEMSVMAWSEEEVGLITAATAQWHDMEILTRQAPEGITITDNTKEMECLLVTGQMRAKSLNRSPKDMIYPHLGCRSAWKGPLQAINAHWRVCRLRANWAGKFTVQMMPRLRFGTRSQVQVQNRLGCGP